MRITFKPDNVSGEFEDQPTILGASSRLGIEIESICGGRGLCRKCKVKVTAGSTFPLTPEERRMLSQEEIEEGYRLACKVKPTADVTVHIPLMSRRRGMRLQTEGVAAAVSLNPAVKKYHVTVPQASLNDQRSDEERFLDALRSASQLERLSIAYSVLPRLPSLLRESGWSVTAVVWNGETVMSVEAGDTSREAYGVAVDVGSTKLALYLLDLNSGMEIAVASAMNPQRSFGEDIISRLAFANRGAENLRRLHTSVLDAINGLIEESCGKAEKPAHKIYEAVFVGNTVMHHFLLGLDTRYLSQSPYVQVLHSPYNLPASVLGLNTNPDGNLHVLPTIRSFVGADNVAVCLATGIADAEKPTLALDIGTNTEIGCGAKDMGLVVTSAASGPAFEGWATKWGMTATDGAIERVFIDPTSFEVMCRTIGDAPPVGICGSGYVDAIAEMMKAGILNHRGGFNKEVRPRCVREGSEGSEIVLASAGETHTFEDVVITQKDIVELVKAKAAIHAAITLLLAHLRLDEEQIDRVLLAGAFGSYIDPENARTIGMLPEVALEKIFPIGNAAGTGAKMALLNIDERKTAERISTAASFVELATHPHFVKEYANSMFLPHKELERYRKTVSGLKGFLTD